MNADDNVFAITDKHWGSAMVRASESAGIGYVVLWLVMMVWRLVLIMIMSVA